MEINRAEKILKALANRRRIKIIKYLQKNKKATVTEIAGHLNLSFKATSKHLAVLKSADIVEAEQVSLSCFYNLNKPSHCLTDQLLSIV